jgi:formiminotetrahydrofolate cyclodeaminase
MAAPLGFSEQTLEAFAARVAEETPAPGGGSVAAVVTGLAAALVAMTARISRDQWEGASGAVAQAEALRARVAPLADEDAEAYESVLAALRMPKDVEPEVRNAVLGNALSRAAEVPLRIAEAAADVAELGSLVAAEGKQSVRGDAAAASVLGEAAVRIATNLVEINLATTQEDQRLGQARKLVTAACAAAKRALAAAP